MYKRILLLLLVTISLLSGCKKETFLISEDTKFQTFTDQLFREEITASSISLHYTLENPSAYGVDSFPISYGTLSADKSTIAAGIENYQQAMKDFDYEKLNEKNQLTYDILNSYLETSASGVDFLLYQEPLSTVSGIHTQLPVLLSEYSFYKEEDVEHYLLLLEEMPHYFESIVTFEAAKVDSGLFMSDQQAEEVAAQCDAFYNMKEQNYLYSTFEERLNGLAELTEAEKSQYISRNKNILETSVFPAYEYLSQSVKEMIGKGTNQQGLCFLPNGQAYFEYLIRLNTGTSESIPSLQQMIKSQILEDLSDMEELIFPTSSQPDPSLLDSTPVSSLLNDLKNKSSAAFPEIPSVETQIKYVPEDMESILSPAFYLIPAIDNYETNVIYINQGQITDGLSLYTTLAHEGYPGHLYQTVYFHATNPAPVRSILDFGGYVEGWATYAEMMSYYMAPLSQTEATLLQKNASLILGLYAYADLGIHYSGWTLKQMSDFFGTYGMSDPVVLNSIYQMILGSPGNYSKYYLGYLKFYELKKEMAEELGSEFSHQDFHKAVLDVGPAPFDIVERYVRQTLL